MGRILGLDLGEVRIGLAIGDETGTIASGLGVYTRKSPDEDLEYLKTLAAQYDIERIVLGFPINMDGSLGPKAREAQEFKRRLEEALKIPVELFDERLTTQEAERVLIEADVSRRKRKRVQDELAAVVILQGYLDRRRQRRSATGS
jgi:putative Holliday junction resolvase